MNDYDKGFDDGYKVAEAKFKYHTKYIIDGYDVGIKELQSKLDLAVEALEKVKRSLDISFLGKPFVMKKSCKELLIIKEALIKIKGEK